MPPSHNQIQIQPEQAGQRVDNFIQALDRQLPKTNIYKWLRTGQVRVNKKRAKPMQKLHSGDWVRLPPFFQAQSSTCGTQPTIAPHWLTQCQQQILYDDRHFLLLNKPAGLAVHAGSGVPYGVIDVLRALYPHHKKLELVHRLDRYTSGCLLLAKKMTALRHASQQVREHRLDKVYVCLVKGQWDKKRHHIHLPLKRQGQNVVVAKDGDEAVSHVHVLTSNADFSWLQVKIDTGRTHQIRVHLKHHGHPIVGDDRYGDFELNKRLQRQTGLSRLALHAHKLCWFGFVDDEMEGTGERICVKAPLPDDLQGTLRYLFPEYLLS